MLYYTTAPIPFLKLNIIYRIIHSKLMLILPNLINKLVFFYKLTPAENAVAGEQLEHLVAQSVGDPDVADGGDDVDDAVYLPLLLPPTRNSMMERL